MTSNSALLNMRMIRTGGVMIRSATFVYLLCTMFTYGIYACQTMFAVDNRKLRYMPAIRYLRPG
jgi:hypothetical protein